MSFNEIAFPYKLQSALIVIKSHPKRLDLVMLIRFQKDCPNSEIRKKNKVLMFISFFSDVNKYFFPNLNVLGFWQQTTPKYFIIL